MLSRKQIYDYAYKLLEEDVTNGGLMPWQKPWDIKKGFPMNIAAKRLYRGINLFTLGRIANKFETAYFLTLKQASEVGVQLPKGEKAIPVYYWGRFDKESIVSKSAKTGFVPIENVNPDDLEIETNTMWFLKYSNVFNIDQFGEEGSAKLREKFLPKMDKQTIYEAEDFIEVAADLLPQIVFGKKPNYNAEQDVIETYNSTAFDSPAKYYHTLFHLYSHALGHPNRLNRYSLDNLPNFGENSFSKEELIAEITASILLAYCGIDEEVNNSTAYAKEWLKHLQNNMQDVFSAYTAAQKNADYLIGMVSMLKKYATA